MKTPHAGPSPILQTVLTCIGCTHHVVAQPPHATVEHHRCGHPDVARRFWVARGSVYTGTRGECPDWCPYLEKESDRG